MGGARVFFLVKMRKNNQTMVVVPGMAWTYISEFYGLQYFFLLRLGHVWDLTVICKCNKHTLANSMCAQN